MVIIWFVRTVNLSMKEICNEKKALSEEGASVLMHEALLPSNGPNGYNVYVKRMCSARVS